jgi:hypothetical protein
MDSHQINTDQLKSLALPMIKNPQQLEDATVDQLINLGSLIRSIGWFKHEFSSFDKYVASKIKPSQTGIQIEFLHSLTKSDCDRASYDLATDMIIDNFDHIS